MNEYERIKQMHHQLYIMKQNKKMIQSKWKKARELIEALITSLPQQQENLKNALNLSVKALLRMQAQEENPPLKKIALDNMNGEPVWVVSYDHDGRWGIVNSNRETVLFYTPDGMEEEGWFEDNYIFRYKKEIKDYTQLMEKYGIQDE